VIFVPYTAHSELATRLRDNGEQIQSMTRYRLKIVEKVGTKLVDLLHRANPGEDCKRLRCLLCLTKQDEGKQNSQDCHKSRASPRHFLRMVIILYFKKRTFSPIFSSF
jgi:hypothetical protein